MPPQNPLPPPPPVGGPQPPVGGYPPPPPPPPLPQPPLPSQPTPPHGPGQFNHTNDPMKKNIFSEPAKADKSASRKLMIRIGVVAVAILLILIIVLVVAKGNSNKNNNNGGNNSKPQNLGPQAAQPIDVDQANASINQDIASIHDDTDFPTNTLDDQTLGL